MRIGAVIKAYRNSKKYGVRGMARIFGVSPATLSRIERGENEIEWATMQKILNYLWGKT